MAHDKTQQSVAATDEFSTTATPSKLSFFPRHRSSFVDNTESPTILIKDKILIALRGRHIPDANAYLVKNINENYDLALTIRNSEQMAIFKSSIYTDQPRCLSSNHPNTLLFNQTEANNLFDKLQILKFNNLDSTSPPSTWDVLVFQHKLLGLIITLQKEIDSFWPYPNKERKQHKITALKELNNLVATAKTFEEAVSTFRTNNQSSFPILIKGNRVKALLTDIAPNIMQSVTKNPNQHI